MPTFRYDAVIVIEDVSRDEAIAVGKTLPGGALELVTSQDSPHYEVLIESCGQPWDEGQH